MKDFQHIFFSHNPEMNKLKIVIDEIVGYLITMALLPRTLTMVIGGFLFFRIFDIIKIPPAGFIEGRFSGGLAVVLDDAVAGIYAVAVRYLVPRRFGGIIIHVKDLNGVGANLL